MVHWGMETDIIVQCHIVRPVIHVLLFSLSQLLSLLLPDKLIKSCTHPYRDRVRGRGSATCTRLPL